MMDRRKFLAALIAPFLAKVTSDNCTMRCVAVDEATNTITFLVPSLWGKAMLAPDGFYEPTGNPL